jgi:hypothetical protein
MVLPVLRQIFRDKNQLKILDLLIAGLKTNSIYTVEAIQKQTKIWSKMKIILILKRLTKLHMIYVLGFQPKVYGYTPNSEVAGKVLGLYNCAYKNFYIKKD